MYTLVLERVVLPTGKVKVEVTFELDNIEEHKKVNVGSLIFPNIKLWGKFKGALQKGALGIDELNIDIRARRLPEVIDEKGEEL